MLHTKFEVLILIRGQELTFYTRIATLIPPPILMLKKSRNLKPHIKMLDIRSRIKLM